MNTQKRKLIYPLDNLSLEEPICLEEDAKSCDAESDFDLVTDALVELPSVTVAYQKLLNRHYAFVYHVAVRIMGNPEDAEEIAQDVMLQVFHKLSTFGGRSSFRSWLYVIVRNVAKNRMTKNQSRKRAEKTHMELHASLSVKALGADGQVDRIQLALKKLDADQREIILLRYLSGLSLEEIAETLEIGLSAAKMRLYRSMEAFKSAWSATDRFIIPYRTEAIK